MRIANESQFLREISVRAIKLLIKCQLKPPDKPPRVFFLPVTFILPSLWSYFGNMMGEEMDEKIDQRVKKGFATTTLITTCKSHKIRNQSSLTLIQV